MANTQAPFPVNLVITANKLQRLSELPNFASEYFIQANPANAQNVLLFRNNADGSLPSVTDATSPNLFAILTPGQFLPYALRFDTHGELYGGEQVNAADYSAISTANARLFINPANRF